MLFTQDRFQIDGFYTALWLAEIIQVEIWLDISVND